MDAMSRAILPGTVNGGISTTCTAVQAVPIPYLEGLTMAEAPFEIPKAHRWFGIQLNNSTMDALDAGLVTAETAEPYIHAAHASCHHWMQVGTVANHGRGEFAVASVYAAAGLGEAAPASRPSLSGAD